MKRQMTQTGTVTHRYVGYAAFYQVAAFLFISATLGILTSKDDPAQLGNVLNGPAMEWRIVWRDEFEGKRIDASKWEYEVNAQGGGNRELQYYTRRSENSHIDGSMLVIRALREFYVGAEGTRHYTSARMRTLSSWQYGRFDIRAKLPHGKGIWPAIWMLPERSLYGSWAASGEIDIAELAGHTSNRVHGTLHYGGEWPDNVHTGSAYTLSEDDFSKGFHVFRLDWEEKEIRWYVDNQHYQTQRQWYSSRAAYPAPFDQRFYLILNLAVGGTWPGNPDSTTEFPQTMTVDYVRVYQ